MTIAGFAEFGSSNNNSSIAEAWFANTLKLTPPEWTVAPSGALAPAVTAERPFAITISSSLVTAFHERAEPLAIANNRGPSPVSLSAVRSPRASGQRSVSAERQEVLRPLV